MIHLLLVTTRLDTTPGESPVACVIAYRECLKLHYVLLFLIPNFQAVFVELPIRSVGCLKQRISGFSYYCEYAWRRCEHTSESGEVGILAISGFAVSRPRNIYVTPLNSLHYVCGPNYRNKYVRFSYWSISYWIPDIPLWQIFYWLYTPEILQYFDPYRLPWCWFSRYLKNDSGVGDLRTSVWPPVVQRYVDNNYCGIHG